jgi:dienelactone hydrolase|tara:strand:- start:197 stop:445 length:249 start_codon:yes stop_codon:yes gene_type:complete
VDFLAELGYDVIAPDSFARREAPTSCKPLVRKGGLCRNALAMRAGTNTKGSTRPRIKRFCPWWLRAIHGFGQAVCKAIAGAS